MRELFVEHELGAGVLHILGRSSSSKEMKEHLWDVECPFDAPLRYSTSEYYVALFTHALWPQADVRTLRLKSNGQAVGALFSVQVLVDGFTWSADEGVARRERMEQYALIALHKMCRNEVRGYQTCTAEPPGGSVVSISDLYHSDTVVAVFTMNAFFPDHLLEKRDAVELNEYFLEHITSFYEIGLYPYPYPAPNWESDEVRVISARRHVPTLSDSADKRNLHLEPLSNNLAVDDKTFLLTVFQSIDPYERSPFFRFFLYYQVFELWIQSTYRTEIASFREALASAEKEDASILRERVHKLTESLRERRRLAKVFANNPDEAMARFLECCNGVLDACGVRTEDDAAVALYSVRNRLVHNFSKATCAQPQFEKLADAMLELVCRIARQYSP